MLFAMWMACGSPPADVPPPPPPPPAVPSLVAGALRVQFSDEAMVVGLATGGEPIGRVTVKELEVDPVDATVGALVELLQGAPAVWIDLPGSMAWYRVRKAVGSARAAGVEQVWLGMEGDPLLPVQSGVEPAIGLKMFCKEPLPWDGVQARVTVSLQQSGEGSWAVANARFLPILNGVPTDGLPAECLAPQSCERFAGLELAACEDGRQTPFAGRVELGGSVGCLLPFLNRPSDLSMWTTEWTPVLKGLGFTSADPILVSPEARVRWDVVVVTLRGFADAGLPVPALGHPLVEGNDGPPMCTADVRDAVSLKAAGARRAGSLMGPKGEEG